MVGHRSKKRRRNLQGRKKCRCLEKMEFRRLSNRRTPFQTRNGPTLGMEPVGCSYYFWANVMSPYGTPKTVHITVSAESGAWEVIAVEVK